MAKRKIRLVMGGASWDKEPTLIADRVYATDDVLFLPNGLRVPKGNSWRLVCEVAITYEGGRAEFEDYVLEPTVDDGQQGPKLYETVPVGRDGKETWHGMDNQFVLPAGLGSPVHFGWLLDVGAFMSQRLEGCDSATRYIYGKYDTRSAA